MSNLTDIFDVSYSKIRSDFRALQKNKLESEDQRDRIGEQQVVHEPLRRGDFEVGLQWVNPS